MAYPNDGLPIDAQITERFRQLLESISTPAFHTDVAQVVFLQAGAEDGLDTPLISAFPLSIPQTIAGLGVVTKKQTWAIGLCRRLEGDGNVDPNALWHEELTWFLADLGHAIRLDDQLGGLAFSVQVSNEVIPPRDSSTLAWAEAEVLISWQVLYSDPSAQC